MKEDTLVVVSMVRGGCASWKGRGLEQGTKGGSRFLVRKLAISQNPVKTF